MYDVSYSYYVRELLAPKCYVSVFIFVCVLIIMKSFIFLYYLSKNTVMYIVLMTLFGFRFLCP